jgi:protein tyrosine/serine phosphatase
MTRWIELDGAANVRDLGGLTTTDGAAIRAGTLLRSDNLQDLTPRDIKLLTGEHGVRNVIDLRSQFEVDKEGPGPLTREPAVTIHHFSLMPESGRATDVAADTVDTDRVLPWRENYRTGTEHQPVIGHYLGYLSTRPDSIVAALRVVATGPAIIHCAAGKDRTGVVIALALHVAGVTREQIVTDYAATGDRVERILARLRASPTYASGLDSRPAESHIPQPAIMEQFLTTLDEHHGGPLGWLRIHGWTDHDTTALRTALRA